MSSIKTNIQEHISWFKDVKEFSGVELAGKGRIGNAIRLRQRDTEFPYIEFNDGIGQFGRSDFTIAFGIKISETADLIDLIGTRIKNGHGNFVCIRFRIREGKKEVLFEVDEDENGTNYIFLRHEAQIDDGTWHHITAVRTGNKLKLYIDGKFAAEHSSSGTANISNEHSLIVGRDIADNSTLAEFEDVRIYERALSDTEIFALVPSLKSGEIKLESQAGVASILDTDAANLKKHSSIEFDKVYLGPDTGTTLYKDPNFTGESQDILANLPILKQTRLGTSPNSVKIWSTVGVPFRGKWVISLPGQRYLSYTPSSLLTLTANPPLGNNELFSFQYDLERQWVQLIPNTKKIGDSVITDGLGLSSRLVCVNENSEDSRQFSLMNDREDQWLKLNSTFLIKAHTDKYWCVRNGGSKDGYIFADAGTPTASAVFELIHLGDNKVALKSVQRGTYVSCLQEGIQQVVAINSLKEPDSLHIHTFTELDDGRVAFKSHANQDNQSQRYFSAQDGLGNRGLEVSADRSSMGSWEKFSLIPCFTWTTEPNERTVFTCEFKVAEHESQVGNLEPGEIAVYESTAYKDKCWVFPTSFPDFRLIEGLDNKVSSVRLGANTGATLYRRPNYAKYTKDPERGKVDIVDSVPDLRAEELQIGENTVSSLKTWINIPHSEASISYTARLSQDYKLKEGGGLEEFSAYRTILKFLPSVTEVELWATDLTTVEISGSSYQIDEDKSVKLRPNAMNRLMVTSEADGLNTPGLKIRTNTMLSHERVVIFPNREAYETLAGLEQGALRKAKKADGNPLINHHKFSESEIDEVQDTVQRAARTIKYKEAQTSTRNASERKSIAAESFGKAVMLDFNPPPEQQVEALAFVVGGTDTSSPARERQPRHLLKRELNDDEFQQLLAEASDPLAQGFFSKVKRGFKKIKNTVKKATKVAIGAVKNTVRVVVKTVKKVAKKVEDAVEEVVEETVSFIIETAEEIGEFVEGVVEKIEVAVTDFVDWLKALFNWDDILKTQRYLADSIDTGLEFAANQASEVKETVRQFMPTLQETVKEGIDSAIDKFENDSSELNEAESDLPEELEWFLAKLTSGAKDPDATPTPNQSSLESSNPSSSSLDDFFSDLLDSFGDIGKVILQGFQELGEVFARLIQNPYRPQLALVTLLKMVKDLMDNLLGVVEGIALNFLDIVSRAVEEFRKVITAEINIPFVKELFEYIGGGKLSLLNVASLLLAIPATVTSKLFFEGELPFGEGPELQLSSRIDSVRGWGITALIADTINGLVTAGLDSVPEGLPDEGNEQTAGAGFEVISLLLDFLSWLASFPDSPGFPGGRPYNIASYGVSKNDNAPEYWERVMWGWRTSVFFLDIVVMAGSFMSGEKLQRLRRRDEATIALSFAFSAVDMGLTTKYLDVARSEGESDALATPLAESMPIVPDLLVFLRLAPSQPQSSIKLAFVDMVCATLLGVVSGAVALHDDIQELKQA